MKKSIRRSQSILVSTVFVLIALIGCHSGNDDDPAAAAELLEQALAPREVQLVAPEIRDERPSVQLVGEIRAFDTVNVSSEVAGKVDRVLAEVGDHVTKDTPLAWVDRSTYKIYLAQAQANLDAANADLALAGKDLERKRDLRSDETIPQSAFDQAQAAHELATAKAAAASAALDFAQRNYDRSVVRAPADGAITQRLIVAGQWAEVGVDLFHLAIGDTIKVSARVPETWAPKLSGLKEFNFTVGASGSVQTAKLYSIEPVVEQNSRSFEIIGTTANKSSIKPGMFANVILESPETKQSLWLPVTAVATSDLPQVLMVEDGAIVFRKVRVGRRVDHLIEIIGGLSAEESVIVDVSGLHRGIPVSVIQ